MVWDSPNLRSCNFDFHSAKSIISYLHSSEVIPIPFQNRQIWNRSQKFDSRYFHGLSYNHCSVIWERALRSVTNWLQRIVCLDPMMMKTRTWSTQRGWPTSRLEKCTTFDGCRRSPTSSLCLIVLQVIMVVIWEWWSWWYADYFDNVIIITMFINNDDDDDDDFGEPGVKLDG